MNATDCCPCLEKLSCHASCRPLVSPSFAAFVRRKGAALMFGTSRCSHSGCLTAQASREKLLGVGADDAEMHSALSKLSILGVLSTEDLAVHAVALFKLCPPDHLLRSGRFQLQWCGMRHGHADGVVQTCRHTVQQLDSGRVPVSS